MEICIDKIINAVKLLKVYGVSVAAHSDVIWVDKPIYDKLPTETAYIKVEPCEEYIKGEFVVKIKKIGGLEYHCALFVPEEKRSEQGQSLIDAKD